MDSAGDTAEAVGCPIRKSTDQSLLAAPHGLSQRAASFIASQCQGIHQMPFIRLFSYLRMRHAQEKAHKGPIPARPHPAKMHRHDPTSSPLLRGDGPVGSSSVTHSLHMSKIPYPPSGRYLLSLSSDISCRVVIGHQRSLFVILPPGGGGRDRTDDLMLAKHALSQLSYAPTGKDRVEQWWAREDLNFRPHAYQARALTN
jgi:hypothetical protein